MISKQDLLKLLKKESSTTLKVLRALPDEKNDFKPHERSSNALQLSSTFVFEMYLLKINILGEELDRSIFKSYKPDSIKTVAEDFEKETNHVISRLEQVPEVELTKTIKFAGHSFGADEFVLMMICDQIHHRGQLSVYVRMAGGLVPSIYGPSGDDTSTNF